MSILETRRIVKRYQRRTVVDGVSLTVNSGSVVGLLGPNGAGKTTTFYSIVGFIRPDQGQVLLDGEELTRLPIHRRARQGLSYLAQDASVFKKLTVRENAAIVLEALGLPPAEVRERTEQLMRELKLEHLADNLGQALSGGERRRVEIMRALATRPRFILLDEPFAGIDPLSIIDLQRIIRTLRDQGLGVLISDHNVRETLSVCDYAYIVNAGAILAQGTAQEVIASEVVRKMYLGENFSM